MDFTRQPTIETIIIPKEGCKLVVRSTKSRGQEEFCVEALEVVSLGAALFFRSLERPKTFLVPANDYEVMEVRETRMVLKSPGSEQSNSERISKGSNRRAPPSKRESSNEQSKTTQKGAISVAAEESSLKKRGEKHGKRRREREKILRVEESEATGKSEATEKAFPINLATLTPPPTLISETIARYKENSQFRRAFITPEEKTLGNQTEVSSEENAEDLLEAMLMHNLDLEPASYSTLGPIEEEPVSVNTKEEFDETST